MCPRRYKLCESSQQIPLNVPRSLCLIIVQHNVFVSESDGALLSGFELSTSVGKSDSEPETSRNICQRYTLRYAAPELLQDSQDDPDAPAGPRRSKTTASDVYAFGMLLYQASSAALSWHDLTVL